jgi:hypothetical protein
MKAFKDPLNTAVYTCTHILREGKPILHVSHDRDDGAWQFMCGASHHDDASGKMVSLRTMVAIDQTLVEIADLKCGYTASRVSPRSNWIVKEHT